MRFYNWYRNNQKTINGILVTVIISIFFNVLTNIEQDLFRNIREVLLQILDIRTPAGFVMWIAAGLFLFSNVIYKIASWRLDRKVFTKEFTPLMKQYTSGYIAGTIGNGCISWGEGKTVQICNDIMFGWKPENVLVTAYQDEMYKFFQGEDRKRKYGEKPYYFSEEDYQSFRNSDAFQKVIRNGNNLQRYMLTDAKTNYDKNNRKLLISLGRTEWSQTSYVWDAFGKRSGTEVDSVKLMEDYSKGISHGSESEPFLPNSFCLHLLIETVDSKVILARISQAKKNDNPGTWAATLGEQLELTDFLDGNNFTDNFVLNWVKRAFKEEYKFDDANFSDMIDEQSIRVLSVDFESDRYNFALCCIVQLRYTFETFYRKVGNKLAADEAIELKSISQDEIPEILLSYGDEEKRGDYHPSTYLRLLMFYFYKNGYARGEQNILKHKAKEKT